MMFPDVVCKYGELNAMTCVDFWIAGNLPEILWALCGIIGSSCDAADASLSMSSVVSIVPIGND